MPRIEDNGIHLYYEVQGTGAPLLFIHGLGSSTVDWEPQVREFSRSHRVVTCDLRGHGRSDKPPGPYSIPMFAADAAELLQALRCGPAHIVGLSLGGCVALQLALDFPGLVRSLVIVNSAPEFVRRSFRTLLETLRRTAIVRWRGLRAMGERIGRRLLPGPGHAALRAEFVARFAQNDPAAYMNSLKALVGWSVTDRLASLRCPVLVVASEYDYSPVATKAKYVQRFPAARLVAIPGAHHAVPVECPAAFNAVVAEFLSALDSPEALDYQLRQSARPLRAPERNEPMTTGSEGVIERIHAIFNHPGLRKFWCRIRYPVALALLVVLALAVRKEWFWIGFGVSMFGELIQLWCFASLKKEKVLACRGPYVLVRNPMYLGRYFLVLGIILLLGWPGVWGVIPYTVFYWFYMFNRVRREEAKLVGIFGADYEAYCRNVNRFLPSPRGGNLQDVVFWNWGLLQGNHGWLNLAALLAAYAVLYLFAFRVN